MIKTSKDKDSARVHIHTLSRYSSNGEGDYKMLALKRMTGKTSFLKFPDDLKKCQIEPQEKCHVEKYFERSQAQCGCIPWGLMDFRDFNPGVRPLNNNVIYNQANRTNSFID